MHRLDFCRDIVEDYSTSSYVTRLTFRVKYAHDLYNLNLHC